MLDGVDLREIPLAALRDAVSVLLQEPFLLPVTVAENISYGRPTARPDEIEAAARAAGAHDLSLSFLTATKPSLGSGAIHCPAANGSGLLSPEHC